jgi:hypothetical protein
VLTNNSGHRFNVQSVALWGNLGLEYTPFIDCQPGTIAGYSSVGFPAWRGKDLSAPPGTPITDLGLELYLSPLSSSPQAVRVTVRIDGASGSDSELLYRDGDTMLTYIELPGSDTVTPKSGRLTLRIEITDYFGYEGWRAPAPAKLPVDSLPAKR